MSQNMLFSPRELEDKISYAFQLSTFQGPLCSEPMQGIAVFLESTTFNVPAEELEGLHREKAGRLTRQYNMELHRAF
jgi:ribosome assembly protein 1